MIRIAVVGVGWAGTRHAEAILSLGDRFSLTALVDPDADHLRRTADRLGGSARPARSFDEILAAPDLDAVSVCTPHALHCAQTISALEAGKHVLVEKPMAMTVAEADRMLEAARANDRRLYVAESAVYEPFTRRVRDIVRRGEVIGAPLAASFAQGFRAPDFGYEDRRRWLTVPELGGTGTWMLHGIHSVARIRFVFGEIASVFLTEHHGETFRRKDLEGTMSGILTTDDGLAISIVQSCETEVPTEYAGFVVHGESGSLHAYRDAMEIRRGDEIETLAIAGDEQTAFQRELVAFAEYVETGRPGPTSGTSERQSLAVVEAGYESARTGRVVAIRSS